MGFFEDIEELLDDLAGELAEELDEDIPEGTTVTVNVVTSKEELDKKVKELQDDGYTLIKVKKESISNDEEDADDSEEEDLPEDEEELFEVLRTKALRSFGRMVKKFGLEKAIKNLDLSMNHGIIDNFLKKDLPLDPEIVERYNALCRELNPEKCDPETLELYYLITRRIAEKRRKEIYDG